MADFIIDWPLTISAASAVFACGAAIVAWAAPHAVESRRQKAVIRELKLDCLRRVIGLRSVRPSPEWLAALNEACVVFSGSKAVISAIREYAEDRWADGARAETALLAVMKAMLSDLDIALPELDDEFLLRPFGTG
ncbi:DUF6680 family protein [Brevundimonas diminuta]|uniref:DUF6680 family protein n=1 Tax=Brevundimonas diminuta TaxID=293 RepID=UPI0032078D54